MHKLIEYICEELEELERKADKDGKLSMAEVQYMDLLAHTKKNLLKGEEMMEEGGGSSYYDGGSSYRRGGSSMAGGESNQSRARGRGRNARRDSMGRYSSERGGRGGRGGQGGGSSYYDGGGSSYVDSMDEMVESIYGIMDELPENVKQEAQKFVKKLESAM